MIWLNEDETNEELYDDFEEYEEDEVDIDEFDDEEEYEREWCD